MQPLYEIILTLLYMIPVTLFRYLSFRSKLRYSFKTTIAILTGTYLILNAIACFFHYYSDFASACNYRFFLYSFYILLSFYLIKDSIRKQFFVLSVYSAYNCMITSTSLFFELLIYPNQPANHLEFKIVSILCIQLISIPLLYYFAYRPLLSILVYTQHIFWNILWIVGMLQVITPVIITFPVFGLVITQKTIAVSRFLLCSSSFIVNIVIVLLLKNIFDENQKNQELAVANQQFEIQALQYAKIKEEIDRERRFRHDFKHHSVMITNIISNPSQDAHTKLAQLKNYFKKYIATIPIHEDVNYCSHFAINLLLNYYVSKAHEQQIEVTVQVMLPGALTIDDTELCVLVGNLFTNAIEAAIQAPTHLRMIKFDIRMQNHNLFFSVCNGFNGVLNKQADGLHSTKNEKRGFGLRSITNIATKYHGFCRFEEDTQNPNLFLSKIHLVLPSSSVSS